MLWSSIVLRNAEENHSGVLHERAMVARRGDDRWKKSSNVPADGWCDATMVARWSAKQVLCKLHAWPFGKYRAKNEDASVENSRTIQILIDGWHQRCTSTSFGLLLWELVTGTAVPEGVRPHRAPKNRGPLSHSTLALFPIKHIYSKHKYAKSDTLSTSFV
jgi:hypothetical protein